MPPYAPEPEVQNGKRQGALAVAFLLAALVTVYLPDGAQQRLAWVLRASVLRPFIATQQRLTDARMRATQVDELRVRLDSMAGVLSTQSALEDENRTLRSLLGLAGRIGPSYLPATVLRPGTPGSESMFLVFVGSDDGVRPGAPVVDRHGLVGVIREVRAGTSVGMDWTHPDFRASAMLPDGATFGIVQTRRGTFREADRLVLTGGAYYGSVPDGTVVVTSGLGGVFPRGIPIGRIDGVAEVEAQWRKGYWLEPMVQPGSATHVLIQVAGSGEDGVGAAWPPDSVLTRGEFLEVERRAAESATGRRPPAPPGSGAGGGP